MCVYVAIIDIIMSTNSYRSARRCIRCIVKLGMGTQWVTMMTGYFFLLDKQIYISMDSFCL